MRKLLLALLCVFGMTGIVLAAEVTLLKYDSGTKKVTVKNGESEATYKLCERTKVTFVDKDGGSKEGTLEAAIKMLSNEKAKGNLKFDIQTEMENITEMKLRYKKK